ncbi:MAG: hypothetical protein NC489_35815, partial [Ruminococcus flavefaciens]|nr:hypothetical protein [Ruminococcus flavefaciens]
EPKGSKPSHRADPAAKGIETKRPENKGNPAAGRKARRQNSFSERKSQKEKVVGTTDPTPPLRGAEGAKFFHMKLKKFFAFRYASPRYRPEIPEKFSWQEGKNAI